MGNKNVSVIAEDMIAAFGSEAGSMVYSRVLDHMRDGDRDGAAFWAQVAGAVRALGWEGLPPGRPSDRLSTSRAL